MSAAAVPAAATALGVVLLGVGIALWVRASFAEEIRRARLKIDRAVMDSLLGGPRFCHALEDEVGERLGAEGCSLGLVRASVLRLEAGGLLRSTESGFVAPKERGREHEPRRIHELTQAGFFRASRFAGAEAGAEAGDVAGDDTLKGLGANDTYHFDDGFGIDTLEERASYKVGKKRLAGGVDTLSFSNVGTAVFVQLVPQWAAHGRNQAYTYGTDGFLRMVDLGASPVERVVGGSGPDRLIGGAANNAIKGGPGGDDVLADYGGCTTCGPTALAASDDAYGGFTAGTGKDRVIDNGGTADSLDLRPLESSDVYFDALDIDGNGTDDSLRLVVSDATSVTVEGHFAPCYEEQLNERMERILFSDEVITSAAEARSLVR